MDMDDDGSGEYSLSVGRILYHVIISEVVMHNLLRIQYYFPTVYRMKAL
ncbi:hypothetical protein [Methanothermobacter sp.]|nr:hypothetical protein [Methanothermobacter sp.]MDI9614131.1 hypothetical protein [Methanothermobacter sp.]